MQTRLNAAVWAKPCPDAIHAFIWRTAAAAVVLVPVIVPVCCAVAAFLRRAGVRYV